MWPMRLGQEKVESEITNPPSTDLYLQQKVNNRRSSSESLVTSSPGLSKSLKPEKLCLNANTNNNSQQSSSQFVCPPSSSSQTSKSDLKTNHRGNDLQTTFSNSLDSFQLSSLQRQAMQLAYIQQQQQHSSALKSRSLTPEEESSSHSLHPMGTSRISPNGVPSGLPNQMHQLLSQQMLNPQQLQSIFQHQVALSAQQRQAQQLQDLYRQQQQKGLQEIQIQLAAASKQQLQKSGSDEAIPSFSDSADPSSKKVKEQQQIQQQLALHQLMQIQQMQQQQQQAAAAALQQQSLAAAVAMAQQGRHQSFLSQPEFSGDFQQLLKHVSDATLKKDNSAPFPFPDAAAQAQTTASSEQTRQSRRRLSNSRSSSEGTPDTIAAHPLYGHGICKWPGCDAECADVTSFFRHLRDVHKLNDKTTAQYRVQLQVVEQLEKQLHLEKERLDAMMTHLRMEGKEINGSESTENGRKSTPNPSSSVSPSAIKSTALMSTSGGLSSVPLPYCSSSSASTPGHHHNNMSLPTSPLSAPHLSGHSSSLFPPAPVSSSPPHFGANLPSGSRDNYLLSSKRRSSTAGPITTDLNENQEFYRNADVRPPFTYASLIRQAIVEAPDCQMTLNEIYNWFQKKFAYFRRNAPTWKSAIRTNLSLHKCFKRCEEVMGSYWTVDDREFRKGRHLKRGRPRKYQEKNASRPQSPSIRGRLDSGTNSSFFGAPLSLQMALGDMPFNSSQLANQSQALLAGNQLPNYAGFLPSNFPGVSFNFAGEAMEVSESSTNALTNGRVSSVSPSSSNQSSKGEKPRNGISLTMQEIGEKERIDSNFREAVKQEEHPERESTTLSEESSESRTTPNISSSNHNIVSARGSFAMLHEPSEME